MFKDFPKGNLALSSNFPRKVPYIAAPPWFKDEHFGVASDWAVNGLPTNGVHGTHFGTNNWIHYNGITNSDFHATIRFTVTGSELVDHGIFTICQADLADWTWMIWADTNNSQLRLGLGVKPSGTSVDYTIDGSIEVGKTYIVVLDRAGTLHRAWLFKDTGDYIDGCQITETLTVDPRLLIGRRSAGDYLDGAVSGFWFVQGQARPAGSIRPAVTNFYGYYLEPANDSPYFLGVPGEAEGPQTHTGTGALTSAVATISGTGTGPEGVTHTGTGAFTAGAAAIAGTSPVMLTDPLFTDVGDTTATIGCTVTGI